MEKKIKIEKKNSLKITLLIRNFPNPLVTFFKINFKHYIQHNYYWLIKKPKYFWVNFLYLNKNKIEKVSQTPNPHKKEVGRERVIAQKKNS